MLQCKYFPRPFNQVPAGTGALANVAHVTSTSGAGFWGLGAFGTECIQPVSAPVSDPSLPCDKRLSAHLIDTHQMSLGVVSCPASLIVEASGEDRTQPSGALGCLISVVLSH